jgi:hypothetical protein
VALVVLIAFDQWNTYKHEKPPKPEISVGGTNLKYALASYSWHGTKGKTDNLPTAATSLKVGNTDPTKLLSVKFSKKPEKVSISLLDAGTHRQAATTVWFWQELPNLPHEYLYVIRAKWDNGRATYLAKVKMIKRVSYQEYLSVEKGKYSVLEILPENVETSLIQSLPQNLQFKFTYNGMGGDLEYLKKSQPDLSFSKTPVFFVFDQKSVVYSTYNINALKLFLQSIE